MDAFYRTHRSVVFPLSCLFTLVLIFTTVHTAPTHQDKCSIFCRAGQASVLNYEAGEYEYEFESEAETRINLRQPESRKLIIQAKVRLISKSACDFAVQVKGLSVSDARGSNIKPLTDLDETTARFTLEDGIIGSVCIDKDEDTYAANIKRAVISLLQNKALKGATAQDVLESDISGKCPTKYVLSNDVYVKTKELGACQNRGGGFSIAHGVPYKVESSRNSLPDLHSKQRCEQTLENGVYKSVKCTEDHDVESIESLNKIQTKITTTLKLVSSKKGTTKIAPLRNLVKTFIFFDYANEVSSSQEQVAAQNARKIVEQICDNLPGDGATSKVPVLVLDLKKVLTHVNKDALSQIYNDIKSGALCSAQPTKLKRLLLDAAAQSASDGSIGLLSELYQQGELDKVTKRYFYLYTTYAARPHEEALQAILPLLSGSGQQLSKRVVLAASGLAHQFCKETHNDCLEFPEYASVVDRIAQIVQDNLRDESQIDNVVTALQALGNLDALTSRGVAAISAALASDNDRLRVRALDAYRRDPCQQTLKTKSQEIFANRENPSNVRISAYLANLRCLQPEDSTFIQRVLDDEDSFQVGGYIQSNLENLIRSSSPSTGQIQSAAKQLHLQLRYPKELRRFSRHLGSSLFSSGFNLGYSTEGNVIFSQKSFIPRQLSANLTLDLFGQSYNFLEVGAYLENFDHVQESLFGPHGKFPIDKEYTPGSLLNAIVKRVGISRPRRAIPGPVQVDREGLFSLRDSVQLEDQSSEPAILDVYVRVYGTTLGVVSVSSNKVEEALDKLKHKIKSFLQETIKSNSRNVDVINPIPVLDDEAIVPTVSGLGLSLTMAATTVPSLEYSREHQLPQDENSPYDLKIKIATNAASSLTLRHSVVGGPIESGLQFEASVRTGGAIEVVLHKESNRVEMKLNLPNEKVRAFDISTNVLWVQRSQGQGETKGEVRPSLHVLPGPESCPTSRPLNRVLGLVGLKVCFSSNVANEPGNPEAWLTGKRYLSLSLEKTEASMEGYSLLFTKQKSANTRKYQLLLDTPGSTTNRKISLTGTCEDDETKRKIDFQLDTPFKGVTAKIEYERTNTENQKGVTAKIILPKATLGVQAELKSTESGSNEITYKPLLRIEYPASKSGNTKKANLLTGKIIRVKGKSLSFDLSSQLPDKTIATISPLDVFVRGTIKADRQSPEQYTYELKDIQAGARDRSQEGDPSPMLMIDGTYKRDGTQQVTDLSIKSGLDTEHTFTYHKSLLREPGHVNLDLRIASTRIPALNFDFEADVRGNRQESRYESSYKLGFGAQKQYSVTSQSTVVAPSRSNFDVKNKLSVSLPIPGRDHTYDASAQTHVKHNAGEEQLVDFELLKGQDGAKGKVTVRFERKAANNNDFLLKVAVNSDRVNGELLQTRHTVSDETSKSFTSSYKYETTLTSSTIGLDKEHLVVYVRLLNKSNKKGISISAKNTVVSSQANIPELTLDLSLKAAQEKYAGHLDVKANSNEVASLDVHLLKIPSATEPQLVIKSFAANLWRIDLTRKTPAEGHYVTKLNAEILRTGRTISLDVDRKRDGNVCKFNADLKWDASRDPSQSAQLHSVTKVTRGSIIIESKNGIIVVGQKVQLNVDATIPTDITRGEHALKVTFVGTDDQSREIEYKNNVGIEPTLRTSKAEISVKAPELPSTEVQWDVKSQNPDLSNLVVDISGNLQVRVNGVSSVTLEGNLESKVSDGKRNVDGKLAIAGDSISCPVTLESNLVVGKKLIRIKSSGKVGETEAEVELQLEEVNDYSEATAKYSVKNLPFLTKYKTLEGELHQRRRIDGQIDISRSHEVKLDGHTALKYSYALSHLNDKLDASADIKVKGNQMLHAKAEGIINREEVNVNGKLQVKDTQIAANTRVNLVNPLKLFVVGIDSGSFGLDTKLASPSQSVYTLNNAIKVQGKKIQLDSEITLLPDQKSFSLKIDRKPGDISGQIKLSLASDGGKKKFQSLFQFGQKTLFIDGNVVKIPGGYDGELQVQGPQNLNGVAKFSVAIEGDRKQVSLVAGDASQPRNLLTLDYTKKQEGATRVAQGTYSTDLLLALGKLMEEDFGSVQGNFKSEYTHLTEESNSEKGCHLKFSTQFHDKSHNIDLDTEMKGTNLEVLTSVQLKRTGAPDVSGVFQLKRTKPSQYPKKYSFQLMFKADSESYGIRSETKREEDAHNLDHKTELVLGNEETDVLGVHVYGKRGQGDACEGGVDLNLPQRQLTVSYVKHSATSGEINGWLDKKREPNDKLTVAVEFEQLTSDDGAKGYRYEATIKHPSLAKDLTVRRKVLRFGDVIVHESNTELDIFQDSGNKIILTAKLAWTDGTHKHLKADVSLTSGGLGLSVEGHGEVTKQDDSIVANIQYSFTGASRNKNSRNMEVSISTRHQSILIGDKANPTLLLSRNVRSGGHRRRRSSSDSSTIDVRYEIHLPGMSDTRIVDVHLHPSVPLHVDVKTFTTAHDGKFYEISAGFPSHRQFLVGAFRTLNNEKTSLAEFSTALNSSRLLSVQATWDIKTIQQVLKAAAERFEAIGDNLEDVTQGYIDRASQEIQETLQKLATALPNLRPLNERISSEFEEIKSEWGQDRPSQTLSQLVNILLQTAEVAAEPLKQLVNVLSQLPEHLKQLKDEIPKLLKKYDRFVKQIKRLIGGAVITTLQTVRPILVQVQILINKVKAKLAEMNIHTMGDARSALREKAQHLLDEILAKISDSFLSRADAIGEFLENSSLRPELKELGTTILKHIVNRLKGEPADISEVIEKFRETVKKLIGQVLTVDLENGVITALIPLPKSVSSLMDVGKSTLATFSMSKIPYRNQLNGIYQIIKNFIRDLTESNLFMALSRALRSNLPPHSADAHIIGSQYFVTFDGKLFHFEGKCQYLLLSDFRTKKFTVAINFHNDEGQIKKSIIISDETESAVINTDFSVNHQGQHIEVEEHAGEVKLTLEDELSVTCNKVRDVCVVTIENGYHFAHVRGLLGNYNNEQFDDLRTPSGQPAANAETFAASWKLNQQCKEKSIPTHSKSSTEAQETCSSTFSSSWSPLSSCYNYSDPKEYEYICNSLAVENGWSVHDAMCTAAFAYEKTCSGIWTPRPTVCT